MDFGAGHFQSWFEDDLFEDDGVEFAVADRVGLGVRGGAGVDVVGAVLFG